MGRWKPLVVLSAAMFLMVLDTSVMNVSISQLVDDFDTEVTTIQAVITLYTLVMAASMVTGGKLGDIWGRRRAFQIGMVVYGIGSGLTAISPTLGVLVLGWSILEGLGAALVLPAMAALVGGAYAGKDRAVAYGVIGGMSGVGIAVGPLLGGYVTTYLTWRLVFAGEVVIVIGILLGLRWVAEVTTVKKPQLDVVGSVLSAAGLALVVLGVLQSSSWGWLRPKNSPVEPLGFSLTPFLIMGGLVVLAGFRRWESYREEKKRDPLVRFSLFAIKSLRSGLSLLLMQSMILLGLFFVIPLYLQIVQGFDAFQTGLRLLPASATMLVASMSGPFLSRFASPRRIVQCGLLVLLIAIIWLIADIKPQIDDVQFALAMATLGIGMGLLASQLGNIVQSSVGESARSEVGGLQFTAQNLGSSLGVALLGSILIGALSFATANKVESDPRISDSVKQDVSVHLSAGISFVSTDEVSAALAKAGVPKDEADAVVESYAEAQLNGLKTALLAAAAISVAALWMARKPIEMPAVPAQAGDASVPTQETPDTPAYAD